MANQSVSLKIKTSETDNWGKPIFKDIQNINNCVVQPQTVYSGTNNNRQIVANAIVYFFANITDPYPKLSPDNVGSKIIFEGKEYTITQIIDNRHPFSNDPWSYELEVL